MLYMRPMRLWELPLFDRHYQMDFPAAERKPLPLIRALTRQGKASMYWFFNKRGVRVAYAVFLGAPRGQTLLLDYFAVLRDFRDQRYGSTALSTICHDLKDQGVGRLLLEIESPGFGKTDSENEVRRRRQHFYLKNGCQATRLRAWVFQTRMDVLCLPCADSQPVATDTLWADYYDMYRNSVGTRLGSYGVTRLPDGP